MLSPIINVLLALILVTFLLARNFSIASTATPPPYKSSLYNTRVISNQRHFTINIRVIDVLLNPCCRSSIKRRHLPPRKSVNQLAVIGIFPFVSHCLTAVPLKGVMISTNDIANGAVASAVVSRFSPDGLSPSPAARGPIMWCGLRPESFAIPSNFKCLTD